MERRPFYLRRNWGTEAPTRWLFLDTETRPTPLDDDTELHTLWFGFALYWHRGHQGRHGSTVLYRFTTPQEVLSLLQRYAADNTRLVVCAHNLRFDLQVLGLLPSLCDLGWDVAQYQDDPGRCAYKLRSSGRTIHLIDSLNWFPVSLAEIGDHIGIPKLPFPGYDAPQVTWDLYCKRDVELLHAAVSRWLDQVKENDLGNYAITLAGQAWNAYRHRFMAVPILVDAHDPRIRLVRAAYYGGRTECFWLGAAPPGDYWLLDANSLYPSVMRHNPFPVLPLGYSEGENGLDKLDYYGADNCVAEVTIDTPEPCYPKRIDGRLTFPVGTFTTALAGPELCHAYRRGRITGIRRVAWYKPAQPFRVWVDELYRLRRGALASGARLEALTWKFLLNMLPGKFGQLIDVWEDYGPNTERRWGSSRIWSDADSAWFRMRIVNGQQQISTGQREGPFAVPAIAAWTTSYARLRLWELVCAAGQEHVYYCDTDSLLVDREGHDRLRPLIVPDKLGALRVVEAASDVEVQAPKWYRIGERIRRSGIPRNAAVLPDGALEYWTFLDADTAAMPEGYTGVLRRRFRSSPLPAERPENHGIQGRQPALRLAEN